MASVGYDQARKTLEIEFQTGDIYECLDVLCDVLRALLDVGSKVASSARRSTASTASRRSGALVSAAAERLV
jgi:hypothetical protein